MLIAQNNKIIIKPIIDNKTESGLLLPDQEQQSEMGEVVGIGNNVMVKLNKGEKIIIKKYSAISINYNNEKYLVCEDKDVLLKIQE